METNTTAATARTEDPKYTQNHKYYYPVLLALVFFLYAPDCIVTAYFVKFLEGVLHFSKPQISTITAFGPIVALAAQAFWTRRANSARCQNDVLQLTTVGTIVLTLTYLFHTRVPQSVLFFYVFAVTVLMNFFRTATTFLCDSITLTCLDRAQRPFGPVRLMGSIGWATASIVCSRLLDGHFGRFPVIVAVLFGLLLCAEAFLPKVRSEAAPKQRGNTWRFIRRKSVFPYVVYIMTFMLGWTLSGTFFFLYYESLGGSASNYGVYQMLITLVEIPVLYNADRILNRFGPAKVLAFAAVVVAARNLYQSLIPSWEWAFAAVLINGFTVLPLFVLPKYMMSVAGPGEKTTGQMVNTTAQILFRSLGSLLSGFIIKYLFGDVIRPIMWVSVVSLLTGAVYILIADKKAAQSQQEFSK
ncbi:MFS transporter [Feifania hominis]|uniref:MFS transporter n=1 Tax=Feifania hominis TaxID=2763660 RepID=A0A926DEU6_9FIRM|nr:MFS transporter [Feifania hominis]MBC8536547.1 MFS transporter [Feifania hominis]